MLVPSKEMEHGPCRSTAHAGYVIGSLRADQRRGMVAVERGEWMPTDVRSVLLVLAVIVFVLAALPIPMRGVNLLAVGLALLAGAFLLG